MSEVCTDNRFELIEKYRAKLIEATNIEDDRDEMAVIENILFRFWQMGWLDRLEQPERKTGKWLIEYLDGIPGRRARIIYCSECCRVSLYRHNFCPNCGAKMEVDHET